ncbi:hypothetical protein KZY93_000674 [Vibrio vulnificus]|nr:hypothetical protein [Vibrio vulnificus]EJD0673064.1 hypothetical protein [Vibrio vulnificus]
MTKHENQLGTIETLKSRVNIRDMMKDQSLSVYDLKDMVSRLNQVIGEVENEVILGDVQTAIKSLLKLGVAVPKELAEKEASLIKDYFPEVTPLSPTKVSGKAKKEGGRDNKVGMFTYKELSAQGKTVGKMGGEVKAVYDLWLIDNPTGDRKSFNAACFKPSELQL